MWVHALVLFPQPTAISCMKLRKDFFLSLAANTCGTPPRRMVLNCMKLPLLSFAPLLPESITLVIQALPPGELPFEEQASTLWRKREGGRGP
jgi:hypothetical protein